MAEGIRPIRSRRTHPAWRRSLSFDVPFAPLAAARVAHHAVSRQSQLDPVHPIARSLRDHLNRNSSPDSSSRSSSHCPGQRPNSLHFLGRENAVQFGDACVRACLRTNFLSAASGGGSLFRKCECDSRFRKTHRPPSVHWPSRLPLSWNACPLSDLLQARTDPLRISRTGHGAPETPGAPPGPTTAAPTELLRTSLKLSQNGAHAGFGSTIAAKSTEFRPKLSLRSSQGPEFDAHGSRRSIG
jgi:hypothetical protein